MVTKGVREYLPFEELVAKDVRNEASNAEIETLKDDPKRWLAELNGLKRDVEIQLNAHKARKADKKLEKPSKQEWLEFQAKEANWRLGALRFWVTVESKMLYVKRLKDYA